MKWDLTWSDHTSLTWTSTNHEYLFTWHLFLEKSVEQVPFYLPVLLPHNLQTKQDCELQQIKSLYPAMNQLSWKLQSMYICNHTSYQRVSEITWTCQSQHFTIFTATILPSSGKCVPSMFPLSSFSTNHNYHYYCTCSKSCTEDLKSSNQFWLDSCWRPTHTSTHSNKCSNSLSSTVFFSGLIRASSQKILKTSTSTLQTCLMNRWTKQIIFHISFA